MSSQPTTLQSQTGIQRHGEISSQAQKPTTALEEDDEFEDFPVEDWPQEDAEALGPAGTNNDHLWEESWDDDDSNEEFSRQLKEELKKVEAMKQQ
ncbi:26S proteasome complex subunit [Coccidioides posadasii str. Silveira]|uniref:26S proteasome complex subunit SEM1 n=2 Tax=Coccidioides TaxID=5500 RepID=A0A0J6YM10_COCIT|nr:hypothetical protein CPAG_07863 [Coccidioides posadasii RMSCC 3488]KMP09686.1 hypothetical protein CIRG_09856 [Coccidioides immitis RMSCC 2394]QVM12751.1 26S proteasome complex subunit [Coccidioides posadasii str. Silveira]TPX20459.1 26S proteasome complex subunit [Coccidioides immitis]